MDMMEGDEPRGWPGAGLREEEGNGEREESRETCRRRDSFMASLSRSLDLEEERRWIHLTVLYVSTAVNVLQYIEVSSSYLSSSTSRM